ncbi:hypothetical protein [Caballeronia choica]|uniref:hypothetical protein n=1 Tax=Caballeronia choica TaxID=326476 RepID=UPI0013587D14
MRRTESRWLVGNIEGAADRLDTLAHAGQSEARTRFCQIYPWNVVGHDHHDLVMFFPFSVSVIRSPSQIDFFSLAVHANFDTRAVMPRQIRVAARIP